MDKELPWLADNAQLELKYKKAKHHSAIAIGQANRCLLSLKASFRHWVMNCYKKQRRKKTLSGVMKTFHWSGSPPSRRPST